MTCWMCCSTDTAVFEVKGRKFWSCEACIMAHIDLPRLAASLEAAKGRKCIDPGCETHNPTPGGFPLADTQPKLCTCGTGSELHVVSCELVSKNWGEIERVGYNAYRMPHAKG
jgi:hypothetical protein